MFGPLASIHYQFIYHCGANIQNDTDQNMTQILKCYDKNIMINLRKQLISHYFIIISFMLNNYLNALKSLSSTQSQFMKKIFNFTVRNFNNTIRSYI